VEDDDGAVAVVTTTVTVDNVAPTLTLDMLEAIDFDGDGEGDAFLGRAGVGQPHNASATDPGSDALTFQWDFDATTVTNSYFVDPILDPAGPDPIGSQNVDPRDVSDTAGVTSTDPGVYTVTLTVTDDDGGSDSLEFTKLVTGDMDEARTQGFWRRQFAGKKKQHIQDEALMAYLDIVDFASRVFSEEVPLTSLEDAKDVFEPGGPDMGDSHPSNIKGKAAQQALATWLNFASGAVLWDQLVPTGQPSDPEDLFSEAIIAIEDVLLDLDGDEDHEDYVLANDIATAINEMDE
jgi:PKD repeat protein